MRVTNNMMLSNYLKNINNNLGSVSKMQQQMASGKRINRLSDDPIGVISALQVRVKMYKTEQYEKNVENALAWLDQTETSVLELNEIIKSAYDTAVNQATGTMTPEDRAAAAELIQNLRDHVVTIGNVKFGDKYLFGGHNVKTAPFEVDASGNILYNGYDLSDASDPGIIAESKKNLAYAVGFGITMDISTNGVTLFGSGEDNLYNVLDGLYKALSGDSGYDDISQYITKLQDAQNDTLALAAQIGGKVNRLELVQTRFEEDILNYTERKSKIEDIDEAEAIMNYQMALAVYTASLQIGSQIIQPSLVNFLS